MADAAADPQIRRVRLEVPATGKKGDAEEAVLVLRYSFVLRAHEGDDTYAVPLVVPEQVTRGDTRVRVWSEPGTLPEPAEEDSNWVKLGIEKVKGKRGQLPVLVLQSQSVDLPLALRLSPTGGERITVLADRALIRVNVTEGQGDRYRASFHLTQLLTKELDVELPAPVRRLGLKVNLDRREVAWDVLDESGHGSESGRVARLRLNPDLVQRSVLEVTYQLPPGHVNAGVFQTVLEPPVLRGEPGRVLTRWQVSLPPGRVALGPEGGAGTPRGWERSGWLFVPRLRENPADMDRWFRGNENLPHTSLESAANPDLICLRSGLEPLTVTYVPSKPWMWCCSLAVLLAGLGLYFLARRAGRGSPGWFWLCLTALVFGLGAVWLFRPTALTALMYGAELGAAVLLVFAALLWLVHERQRRQIVFLPSFRRGRGGSSVIRALTPHPAPGGGRVAGMATGREGEAPAEPRRSEPSTVDGPQRAASNY